MTARTGRPRGSETRRRTQEFLRLLGQGVAPVDAARVAGVKPDRVLRLLGDPTFRLAVCTLLEQAQAA